MNTLSYRIMAAGTVLILALTGVARANASVDRAEPRPGSSLIAAPSEVKVWFSQAIDPAVSALQVFDTAGKQVDKHDCRRDSTDKKLLIVSLASTVPPGTYKVVWHAVSSEAHRTHGDFKFTIKP